jgi:hypothetical protein
MKVNRSLLLAVATINSIVAYGSELVRAIPTGDTAPAKAAQGVCILTLRIEQLHWTLNPVTWIKDSVNASTLEIPTLPSYCSQLHVGQLLADDFRWGSYLLHGSTGDTQVRVVKIDMPTGKRAANR